MTKQTLINIEEKPNKKELLGFYTNGKRDNKGNLELYKIENCYYDYPNSNSEAQFIQCEYKRIWNTTDNQNNASELLFHVQKLLRR